MTIENNQQPVNQLPDPLATNTSELSQADQSLRKPQTLENPETDALKAFARALMVSLTWSMAGLSHRK